MKADVKSSGPDIRSSMGRLETRLVVHHVGARNATTSFGRSHKLDKYLVNVMFDADPECIEQVTERTGGLGTAIILPYCIGLRPGPAVLNVNYDPFASSLLETDPTFGQHYLFIKEYDYVFGEILRTMRKIDVTVVTLDEILGPKVPAPDFLSIDAEGTSLNILEGARNALEADVLGLVCEIEFCAFRHGQRLFPDVARFLADRGFEFIQFTHLIEAAPYRRPIGLRGRGRIFNGDSLFLRSPESVAQRYADPCARALKLYKLAWIALRFGLVETALRAAELARIDGVDALHASGMAIPQYVGFLSELETIARQVPSRYPPTFAETYSFEQSARRSQSSSQITYSGWRGRLKRWLLLHPTTLAALRRVRYAMWSCRDAAQAAARALHRRVLPGTTPFEAKLREYGFDEVADLVRDRRLQQWHFAR